MKIKILTSAMGLGTYVPALHLYDFLRQKGHDVSMEVFEAYFSEEVMKRYQKNKKEYHRNFKVAKLGHKLAEKRLGSVLDSCREEAILAAWEEETVTRFIILSGNWISTVRRYQERVKEKLKAVVVHMDVETPPSWKHFDNQDGFFTELKPFNEEGIQYLCETGYEEAKTDVNSSAEKVFFFHGGGWGMGDYQKKKEELQTELDCTVMELVHELEEIKPAPKTCYYRMDSEWEPWVSNEKGSFSYPVMIDVNGVQLDNRRMKGLYQLYGKCAAIISKPGGGTILDSVVTGVPVVFLEPVAEHERKNMEAWESCGMGIRYSVWKESGYSMELLEHLRDSIGKNREGKKGIGTCIEKILE